MVKSPGGYFSNKEIEQVGTLSANNSNQQRSMHCMSLKYFHICMQAMQKHKPVLFFLTHGESSAGLCHPVDGIGDICKK